MPTIKEAQRMVNDLEYEKGFSHETLEIFAQIDALVSITLE